MTGFPGTTAAAAAGEAAGPPARRPGEARDAVAGVRPAAVFSPVTVEEAAAVVAESAREGRALVFAGGRTDMDLGAPPSRLDAVVETGGLARILEHAPSDQIAVVEAGVTIAALQRALAERGQRLALDPPRPDHATVGGVIAANAFGPLRASAGSVRDLLIGVSFLRADGVSVRGGGKVVKNVAGFDLPKLMVGSLGTLGMIATATFRLHPLPETGATVMFAGCTPGEVDAIATALREGALEPASVVALSSGQGRFDLAVRFEGFGAGVTEQRERTASLRPGKPNEIADAGAEAAFWARHAAIREGGPLRVKVAAPRDATEAVARRALDPLSAAAPGAAAWYPTIGLGFLAGDPAGSEGAAVDVLAAARDALRGLGGSLVVCAAPPEISSRVDPWGPAPVSFPLMEAMKARLDPDRRFAPGRFVGGI
jgi:glycolate oxidase FAD binding subunit